MVSRCMWYEYSHCSNKKMTPRKHSEQNKLKNMGGLHYDFGEDDEDEE